MTRGGINRPWCCWKVNTGLCRIAILAFAFCLVIAASNSASTQEPGLERTIAANTGDPIGGLSTSPSVESGGRSLTATLAEPQSQALRPASIPMFEAGQAPHPIVFSLNGQFWRVFPDGSEAQPTGILAAEDNPVIRVGGRFRHGSEAPVLSPDRQQLAYIENGDLFIADLEQAEPTMAIHVRNGREAIVINSWTPDGERLLAYVENTGSHEGHYRQVDGRSLEVSELPFIERIAAWTTDSSAVLFDQTDRDSIALLSQSVADGESRTIASSSGRDAYRPLSAAQGRLAFIEDSQLCVIPEDGGASEVVVPAGGTSDIIRPVLAPDGNRIAFLQQPEDRTGQARLSVVDLESRQIQAIATCGNRCEFLWYNPQHLLYTDAQRRLYLVDLQGHQMLLARGAHLVGIGQPL